MGDINEPAQIQTKVAHEAEYSRLRAASVGALDIGNNAYPSLTSITVNVQQVENGWTVMIHNNTFNPHGEYRQPKIFVANSDEEAVSIAKVQLQKMLGIV